MPTTNTQVIYDQGNTVTRDLTRWPAFESKFDLLAALVNAIGGGAPAISDVIQRLSNTDTSAEFVDDPGSRAR